MNGLNTSLPSGFSSARDTPMTQKHCSFHYNYGTVTFRRQEFRCVRAASVEKERPSNLYKVADPHGKLPHHHTTQLIMHDELLRLSSTIIVTKHSTSTNERHERKRATSHHHGLTASKASLLLSALRLRIILCCEELPRDGSDSELLQLRLLCASTSASGTAFLRWTP